MLELAGTFQLHIQSFADVIELIFNDGENIARCRIACNASKGARELAVWLQSADCKRKRIDAESVARGVKTVAPGALLVA